MATSTKTRPTTMLVRIHPPSKRQGYLAESYILSGSSYPKFLWTQGWYTVDAKTAETLSTKLNNPNDRGSRPIFDVCTHEEAKALDTAEKIQVAEADDPIPMPRSISTPTREEARAKSEKADLDEGMDLSDNDDDWDDNEDLTPTLPASDLIETADDDIDDLVTPPAPAKPKPVRRAAKKKATKKARKKSR